MKVLAALAVLIGLLAVPAAAAPLSAYARLPAVEAVTISPDGSQVAMVVTDGERRTVAVQDTATRAFKARADFGDVPVQAIRWGDERHLLITTAVQFDPTSVTGGLMEWRRLHIFDVAASALTTTMEDTPDHRSAIQRAPAVRVVDGKPAVFVEGIQFVNRHGYIAVFQIDLATGRSRIVQPAVEGSRRWLVGRDGKVVARQMYDDRPRRWTIEVRDKTGWRVVHTATPPQAAATLVGLGRDGQSVIYSVRDGGETSWREVRLDGGPETAVALPPSHGPVVDPQSGQILGHAGWDGDTYQTVYLDPADDRVMRTVRDTYPAFSASIASWSNDRSKVAVQIDRPGHSPAFALFDMAARRAEWIGAQYPELTDADIASQSRVRFKAADGLELSGYLTRPPGQSQARNLPLIVYPHDGPATRDTPGFDWIAQAIASRGYAVLQLNFRGSGELGPSLLQAGYGEIGRKMQTDLSDGVRALAAGGLIDPKRVCVVGQGYGGYAALAGATLDPAVYRCAASIGGSFFALRWPESDAGPGSAGAAAAARRLGADGPDDPRLVQYSPLRQAQKAEIPILLIHGKADTVFPPRNSEDMAAALNKAGKPVELRLLDSGDRQFSRASAGTEMLNALVTFLEKNNPPN